MSTFQNHKPVAFFPGQGSQHVGMAKDLLENFKTARETFEEASDSISLDLRHLCLEGPESDLILTENTQPALLTASVAAFRVASRELGFAPTAVAGHSLGEYSALVAAEALPLATAVRWVRERGKAMQAAVPAGQGTMAAILGLEDQTIEVLCARATEQARSRRQAGESAELTVESLVEPANFNAPGQIVIAGSIDAVAEAVALIKGGTEFPGGKAIPLSVSAPFHCKLMARARSRMGELFSQASEVEKARRPVCPYVPNRTARLTQEAGVVFELLVEQVDHPVLWKQSVEGLIAAGHTLTVEFGPGKVLSGLNKRIGQAVGKVPTSMNVSDKTTLAALETAMKG